MADKWQLILQAYPQVKIRKKADVWWWVWILGPVLKIFCKTIMTDFFTTLARTVYLPSDPRFETSEHWLTLAHETRHVERYEAHPVLFTLGYLFPQVGVLGTLGALGAIGGNLSYMWFLLFLLCLAPWPAPWRVREEVEGYAITLLGLSFTDSQAITRYLEPIVGHFTGWSYYRMSWSSTAVRKALQERVAELREKPDKLCLLLR